MARLMVGNWKENPATLREAFALGQELALIQIPEGTAMVVCPPDTYLAPISSQCPNLILGAQDVSILPVGAHTGEVGAEMLTDLRVQFVIVGHSERRAMGETDADVANKLLVAKAAGMRPIVCVGEPKEVRVLGPEAVRTFLQRQLDAIPPCEEIVVAYEPIWAIGHDVADDPADASAIAGWIAGYLKDRVGHVMVLYGGSVTPQNAAPLIREPYIDGFLVGHASLNASTFAQIVTAR